jgi:hypothetical protein
MKTSNRLAAIAAALRPIVAAARKLEAELPDGWTQTVAEMTAVDLGRALDRLSAEVVILRQGND